MDAEADTSPLGGGAGATDPGFADAVVVKHLTKLQGRKMTCCRTRDAFRTLVFLGAREVVVVDAPMITTKGYTYFLHTYQKVSCSTRGCRYS